MSVSDELDAQSFLFAFINHGYQGLVSLTPRGDGNAIATFDSRESLSWAMDNGTDGPSYPGSYSLNVFQGSTHPLARMRFLRHGNVSYYPFTNFASGLNHRPTNQPPFASMAPSQPTFAQYRPNFVQASFGQAPYSQPPFAHAPYGQAPIEQPPNLLPNHRFNRKLHNLQLLSHRLPHCLYRQLVHNCTSRPPSLRKVRHVLRGTMTSTDKKAREDLAVPFMKLSWGARDFLQLDGFVRRSSNSRH